MYDGGIMRKCPHGPLSADDWAVYLDMDGTITDFYGVSGWQAFLETRDSHPYRAAEPLVDMSYLAIFLNNIRRAGYKLGISSWFAQNHSPEYDVRVADAKLKWISENLPEMDEVLITPYGSPKHSFVAPSRALLFDDDEKVRASWEASGPERTALPEKLIIDEKLRKQTEQRLISEIAARHHGSRPSFSC